MNEQDKGAKIIANESNQMFEIERTDADAAREPNTTADKMRAKQQLETSFAKKDSDALHNDLANNDGSLVETLDAALHDSTGENNLTLKNVNAATQDGAFSESQADTAEELQA